MSVRSKTFEEAAQVCREVGARREGKTRGRDYDAFAEGAKAACYELAVELEAKAHAVKTKPREAS